MPGGIPLCRRNPGNLLIITPAMCADAESPEFPFTYTAIKRETSPKAEAP